MAVAPAPQVAPNYGQRKVYVDAQLDPKLTPPSGTTTVGTQVSWDFVAPGGQSDGSGSCVTANFGGTAGSSTCDLGPFPAFSDDYPTDTIVVALISAPGDLVAQQQTFTIPPCDQNTSSNCNDYVTFVEGLPPAAVDDTASVTDGQSVTVDALANDTTYGIDRSGFAVTTAPAHGTATVVPAANASGSPTISYTPALGFAGTDTFGYTVSTAYGSASATVTVTVAGAPPVAVDDTASVTDGQSVDVDVLANDSTVGFPRTGFAVTTAPGHGTAKVVPAATASGSPTISYTPALGFAGTDTFGYTLSTAYGSATATVTVTVAGVPPTAVDDSARTVSGQAVTVDVLANDDAHGFTPLTLRSVGTPRHGAARIVGGKVVYTPAADFVGTDSFGYVAATRYGTATATVTVTVTAPPPAPATQRTAGLAATGVDSEGMLGWAAGLLVAGAAATLGGRRRRRPRRAG